MFGTWIFMITSLCHVCLDADANSLEQCLLIYSTEKVSKSWQICYDVEVECLRKILVIMASPGTIERSHLHMGPWMFWLIMPGMIRNSLRAFVPLSRHYFQVVRPLVASFTFMITSDLVIRRRDMVDVGNCKMQAISINALPTD